MDPEITETGAEGAAPAEDTAPSWATDALDALIGDDYSDVEEEPTEGGPAGDTALEPEGGDDETAEPGNDPTTTEGDDDLPDDLKKLLDGLSRTQKGKFTSHFQGKAEKTLAEAQKLADQAKTDADAREAKATEVRQARGKYIGEVEFQREDGTTVPTYKELERLLKTPGGDDVLEDKYGLSTREAQEQLSAWDERKAMLDGSLDDFRTEAWVESGKQIATSVAQSGLPIDVIWKGVKGIEDVVPSVVKHLTAQHEAALAAQKKDYEGRLRAATANGTATAARTAARTMPTPETGGRGDSGSGRIYRQSELNDIAFVRANEADIDRAYDEGRIVPD